MVDYSGRLKRAYKERVRESDGALTQIKLSEATGLAQSVISEAMDFDKVGQTASVIVRLCLALDVSLDFVLTGAGDEIPRLARRSASSPIPRAVELREASAPIVPELAAPTPPEPGPAQPSTHTQKARRRGARR
jgi:transcriptional regulator with XRE-family HTH domain